MNVKTTESKGDIITQIILLLGIAGGILWLSYGAA